MNNMYTVSIQYMSAEALNKGVITLIRSAEALNRSVVALIRSVKALNKSAETLNRSVVALVPIYSQFSLKQSYNYM